MNLIVQKYGGSSVSSVDKIINISKIIIDTYNKDNNVLVVVSAQGDTTNWLLNKMLKINRNYSKREMDVLLSVGEQISIALLTSYLNSLGYSAISLTGWQAGIKTDNKYGSARIKFIDNVRILKELKNRKIVVVAGFQGIDISNNITTLGRGGSDTSAVALAISLKASVCQIFTDVDGIFTADPRLVKSAKKINEITFDEMLEMSSSGAKVLNNRSVELAKKYNLEIDVVSSFNKTSGTRVKEEIKLEKNPIRGITCDNNIAIIKTQNKFDKIQEMLKIFEVNNISVSGISFNNINNQDFYFIVSKEQNFEIENIISKNNLEYNDNISKISIVGTGLMSNNYILSKLFDILNKNNVEPYFILTGEIMISIFVDFEIATDVMNILHDEYNLGDTK